MRRLTLAVALGLSMLCAGCATAPPRLPVAPEPDNVLQSAECAEVGSPDMASFGTLKFDPWPYGWVQARVDVERGVVVNVEVLDSSPRKLFEAQTTALFKSLRFPSLATAKGCVWSHKWD